MLKKIGLIMVSLALLLGMTGCKELFSTMGAETAWNFDFEGTSWQKTTVEESYSKVTETYAASVRTGIASTVVPVLEKVETVTFGKKDKTLGYRPVTYTAVFRFGSGFDGNFNDEALVADGTRSLFTASAIDVADKGVSGSDLPLGANIYTGFAGQTIYTLTVSGMYEEVKDGANQNLVYMKMMNATVAATSLSATYDAGSDTYTYAGAADPAVSEVLAADNSKNSIVLSPSMSSGGNDYFIVDAADAAIMEWFRLSADVNISGDWNADASGRVDLEEFSQVVE